MSQRNTGKARSYYPPPGDEPPSPTLLDDNDAPTLDPDTLAIDDEYGGEAVDFAHEQWLQASMVRASHDVSYVDSLSPSKLHALAKHLHAFPLYAVRCGLYPGVYRTWPAAKRVVGDWMPKGKFGQDRTGSLRKFNCPMQAWRFVSRGEWGDSAAYDESNAYLTLQSLPPPAGFTIPSPMIIVTAGGALQHLEPPIVPPDVRTDEPLSLLNGDNADFRRLPAGICVGDARVHYHRVEAGLVRCGPYNRPQGSMVMQVDEVIRGVPGYPSTLMNNATVTSTPTSSPPAASPSSVSPIRTPASHAARISSLSQALHSHSPTRVQPRVPSGSSKFSLSQPPPPSPLSQPRASTSKASTSSQPSSPRVQTGGSDPRAGVVSRTSSQTSDRSNVEISFDEYRQLQQDSQNFRRMNAPPSCVCVCNSQFPNLICRCCARRCGH
ncbi:hypothetical protein FRC09_005379 [Ceratobasidium sp. 395]|nr:hypothetical protein FRC09_005379 [Ceratobasidium sp. 395]